MTLRTALAPGGGRVMWERAVREVLPTIKNLVQPGSMVFEIGYGNGLLSCYFCQELGWRMVGVEIDREAQQNAELHAREYGLTERIDFLCGDPEEAYRQRGQFDAVFIKTVLYHAKSLEEYGQWLDRIVPVLRPGGILINFETGKANALTQCYRRLRRRSYTDLCLYTRQVEVLYEARFDIIERRYYGGLSQFLTPLPFIYTMAACLEENLRPRHADNCFIASIIARRPL